MINILSVKATEKTDSHNNIIYLIMCQDDEMQTYSVSQPFKYAPQVGIWDGTLDTSRQWPRLVRRPKDELPAGQLAAPITVPSNPQDKVPAPKVQDDVWLRKDRSMARMSALKSAAEVYAAKLSVGEADEDVLTLANKLFAWIEG